MSVEVMSAGSNTRVVGTYHISDRETRRIKRPRSTPANATRPTSYGHVTYATPSSAVSENGASLRMNRPKTAAAILGITRDCDRVSQLEHEATRRHNLESHMPVKKNKPPPWQKNIDPPLVPFVVGPGYILSKSKSKFAVTLKDEFFEPPQDEESKNKKQDHERDNLISNLQDRISDLTLFLEEERLNHKQTKHRGEESLRSKIEDLEEARRNAITDKDHEHKEEMENMKSELDLQHTEYKNTTDAQINRQKKEIEFLQGAFESYKSSLHLEFMDKWTKKRDDLQSELEEQKTKEIHEMRMKILQEKTIEKNNFSKEYHRAMDNLRKEHKRDLDSLVRKYSNVAADLERLKKCTAELEETKSELAILTERYNETCQQLTSITRNLTDTKVKLMAFEEQFDLKVQEVDEKYKKKIHDLMTQNIELKRLYVSKCGELYDEKVLFERDRVDRVMTAKETMNKMLMSKHKAEVNLTPSIKEIEDKKRVPKMRPGSAPSTKLETRNAALSAGETEHLRHQESEEVRPTVILPEDSEEIEALRRSLMEDVKSMSREELMQTISDTVS